MRPLSARDVLHVWDSGSDLPPWQRDLLLLGRACPELTDEQLKDLDVGERDARLVQLRQLTFGRTLQGVVSCPQCKEALEFTIDTSHIDGARLRLGTRDRHVLAVDDVEVHFRLPSSRDLEASAICGDPTTARRVLVCRCVMDATARGEPVDAGDLREHVCEALAAGMAAAAPQSDLQLDFACPECGGVWQAALEIGSFFWAELVAEARRLLRDVHTLARAYGWREADILAMSETRRACYLDLVS